MKISRRRLMQLSATVAPGVPLLCAFGRRGLTPMQISRRAQFQRARLSRHGTLSLQDIKRIRELRDHSRKEIST